MGIMEKIYEGPTLGEKHGGGETFLLHGIPDTIKKKKRPGGKYDESKGKSKAPD